MANYRRVKLHGGTFFFTVISYDRRPIFTTEIARALLRSSWRETQESHPFTTDAICLLPEHIHCIWTLPDGDGDYSLRWRKIKSRFTSRIKDTGISTSTASKSRQRRGESTIWQRRFWEHWIRDEQDLNRHIDYIHYNPVKHGHVNAPADWQWSSFSRFMKQGLYLPGWGASGEPGTCDALPCIDSEP